MSKAARVRLTEDMPLSTGEDPTGVVSEVTLMNPSKSASVYVPTLNGPVRVGPTESMTMESSQFNAAVRELVTSGTLVTR